MKERNKRSKKIFSAIGAFMLASVMVSGFSACAGKGTSEDGGESGGATSPSDAEIYMPDGAPALSMAKLMYEDTDDDGVNYHVVDSSTISVYVTGKNPKADLCVLPVNLASKLLGTGETYRLLGTVTHGNLYFLSVDSSVQYTSENLSGLVGKTVGVVQLQNVPGLTLKVVLDENGIPWQELTDGAESSPDKVNLQAVLPEEVTPAGGKDVYLAPEPAASVKVDKTTLGFVGDLQAMYGEGNGYPQAVLVAKTSFIAEYGEWVDGFLTKMTEAAAWLTDGAADAQTVVSAVAAHLTEGLTPSLSTANLSATAVAHSGVRFESASECKAEIDAFLAKLIAVDGNMASPVSEAFYYLPENRE